MRDAKEYHKFSESVCCHFCDRDIFITSNADLDALILPEWACWAAGCLDFDDLGLNAVCPACAEQRVGSGWREKAREALAFNDAYLAAGRTEPDLRVRH